MNRDVEFLFEMSASRFVDRTWKTFFGGWPVANNAEHAFRVCWLALIIASRERKNLDHAKMLKMALAHDLPEGRCGDANYLSRQYMSRNEEKAARDMFEQTAMSRDVVPLLEEYNARKTPEAKIVKDADNLDVDLELQEMVQNGNAAAQALLKRRRREDYPGLFTTSAKKLQRAIYAGKPFDWHARSPHNRFNGGDWQRMREPKRSKGKTTKKHR